MLLRRLLVLGTGLLLPLALRATLAPAAAEAHPLPVGAKVPAAMVQTIDGTEVDLAAICARKPTLLVFYRGSWCPYCNKHLAALAAIEPQLLALGYQIVAVSPDDAAGLKAMAGKNQLDYQLLSDRGMQAATAFGVAFRVDGAVLAKYQQYKIELAPVPDEPAARWLPVPSAFLIGRDGAIRFVHSDPDYKVRLSADEVLAAAKAAL